MADFLNRLAGRALGAIPLAEPVIPTRFSPGTEPAASFASEFAFQTTRPSSETAQELASEFSKDRAQPLRSRADQPISEPPTDRHASPLDEPDEAPHRPQSQHPRAVETQHFQSFPRDRETVQPSPEPVQAQRQHSVSAIDPLAEDLERVAAHRPPEISTEAVPFAEPRLAPRPTPLVEPTRAATAQQAESPLAFRQAPPTVRISIGRIEVRAEIAAPPPARPTQRSSQPSTLSLDEFLRQAGSRR